MIYYILTLFTPPSYDFSKTRETIAKITSDSSSDLRGNDNKKGVIIITYSLL
ncbi:MAG: hypothetical protein WBG30_12985 [Psychrilyobacter sp.]